MHAPSWHCTSLLQATQFLTLPGAIATHLSAVRSQVLPPVHAISSPSLHSTHLPMSHEVVPAWLAHWLEAVQGTHAPLSHLALAASLQSPSARHATHLLVPLSQRGFGS